MRYLHSAMVKRVLLVYFFETYAPRKILVYQLN